MKIENSFVKWFYGRRHISSSVKLKTVLSSGFMGGGIWRDQLN